MVINPPLLLVSALFFLALCSALYLATWLLAGIALRLRSWRLAHRNRKRLLLVALMAPPALAAIPTFSGATLYHLHETTFADHHSIGCESMFSQLSSLGGLIGNAPFLSALGVILPGSAWGLIAVGIALIFRLILASLRLERGLRSFLKPPSARLSAALERHHQRCPWLPKGRFFECAIPANCSSVFGFFRSRCVLSESFVIEATDKELDAVVAHEASHLTEGDVRSIFMVGVLNCLFFYLRPVRLLSQQFREAAELACDDAAVSLTREPLSMASAILKASGVSVESVRAKLPPAALAFADEAACSPALRVERLMVQAERASFPGVAVSPPSATLAGWIVMALLAAVGLLLLFSAAMACLAHCSLEALAHLF